MPGGHGLVRGENQLGPDPALQPVPDQPAIQLVGLAKEEMGKRLQGPQLQSVVQPVGKLDPEAFAGALCRWMGSHLGSLPSALALDGKYVRDRVLTLCLSEHEHGAPVAVAITADKPHTEDNKKDGELTKAKALIGKTNLDGAVVTGDALYDTKGIARQIVENGGDYLIQTKDARLKPVKRAKELLQGDSFFFGPQCSPNPQRSFLKTSWSRGMALPAEDPFRFSRKSSLGGLIHW